MKKLLFLILLLAALADGTNAQNAPDNKLKRTTLFTLGEHEEIFYGEYFVFQKLNQNRFACIIEDTLNDKHTFVFNGKRIITADYLDTRSADVHEENGYVVKYRSEGDWCVNIKGEVYGPFDERSLTFAEDNKGDKNYDRFYYRKTEGENTNYYIHYDSVKAGPFEMISFPYKHGAFSDCEYLYALTGKCYAHYSNGDNKMTPLVLGDSYYKNGKEYVNINGNESNGYDRVYLHLTESGKCAYEYKENGKWHVNIDGSPSSGYDEVDYLRITESGKYTYLYQENEKWYVNVNGSPSRGYDEVGYLQLIESGKCAYSYRENGKWYVNIDGSESSGYDYVYDLHLTESGKYAYWYQENGKAYVNIDGSPSSGYDAVGYLQLVESGKYAYSYKENEKYYVNIDGSPSSGYDVVGYLRIIESGKYAYWYKENGKYHVNIDGSPSSGYDYYVDYLHLTESGKYAYNYKENGKWYVNIDGRPSRGYDDYIYSLHFTESGKCAYKYKENGKWYVNIDGRDYSNIYAISSDEDGNYIFHFDRGDGRIYKNDNGKETETGFWSGMADPAGYLALFGNTNKTHAYNEDKNWASAIEIYSTDRKHSFHSTYKHEYVVINDVRHAHAPALYAWYDNARNAFVWNSVEGKELVVYEYALD